MSVNSPACSVVVAVFNTGEYLDRMVASVLAQTVTDFELILVDDGSEDGAVERVALNKDPRLKILRQEHAGAPSALNRGVDAARADFIAFIDADDLWAPDKLRLSLAAISAEPDVDLTFDGLIYIGADDRPIGLPARTSSRRFSFEQLFLDYALGSSSVIVARRQAVCNAGGFDPEMLYSFDVDLVLRIARLRPNNILAIPELLTLYRRRPGQQTGDWRMMAKYWAKLVAKFKSLGALEVEPLERGANANMSRYFAYLAYEQGNFEEASLLLAGALGADRLRFLGDFRNWKLSLACSTGLVLPRRVHRWLEALAGLRLSPQR